MSNFKLNSQFDLLFQKTIPYLKKIKKKDYIIHTFCVTKAMEELIKHKGGDEELLIPAAILHDIGWVNVPEDLQTSQDKNQNQLANRKHLEEAAPLIREILSTFNYSKSKINQIINIVQAHKFCDPEEKEKQLLIDADNLSDAFKEAFYADCQAYHGKPEDHYQFRIKSNQFYSKTAQELFSKMMADRKKEIESGLFDKN